MFLTEAEETFTVPMVHHGAQFYARFVIASQAVGGSADRVAEVFDDIRTYDEFGSRVGHCLERGTFLNLPRLRGHDGRFIEGIHKLTVGCWEGAFLVSKDGSQVIGLVFSRAPHDYNGLLGDLLVANAKSNPT